jgi:hypothetical protein
MGAMKAWLAALITSLSTFLDEWTGPTDPLTPRDYLVATVAGLVAFNAVYFTPNRIPPDS